MRTRSVAFVLAALFPGSTVGATVRIAVGPTPIPGGQASAPTDITIINDRLAIGLAVGTAPPWAIPRGALIDAAPVVRGRIGEDRVTFADFLPNSWSAWPSDRQDVRIVKDTPTEAIVEAVRSWGQVEIRTRYVVRDGDDSVHLSVTMTNRGPAHVVKALSGFVLWSKGGHFFGVPGLPHIREGSSAGALADRIVAYDADWAIAMHMPGFDRFGFDQKDLYRETTLAPGESRTLEGRLQIVPHGDLAPIMAAEAQSDGLGFGQLSGRVTQSGGVDVPVPVVVVEKDGVPLGWTAGQGGKYALTLPPGHYQLYATADGCSETSRAQVDVVQGQRATQSFTGLEPSGRVHVSVQDKATGRPIDAKLTIEQGQRPLVQYLGRHSFFTDLDRIGEGDIRIAPGDYMFSVQSGAGFTTRPVRIAATVRSDETQTLAVAVERAFKPERQHWFAADMHHHSDQADGVTPPADVARSELAAGLDLLFLSDHDSTVNNGAMATIAAKRGMPFIPSAELSPAWGHFNAYPLRLGAPVKLEMATATAADVFAEAHRLGATAIQVNHPYADGEGYLASVDKGVAHGGLDPHFDLLEINGALPDEDAKVLARAWASWGTSRPYFLSAGSDTHDVWNGQSGDARTYAYVPGALTATGFIDAVRKGHAYVSHGPLIVPDHMFGETLAVKAGQAVRLGFDVAAVTGLGRVSVIRDGKVDRVIAFQDRRARAHVSVDARADPKSWYALTVEDVDGQTAYTNPIWLMTIP